jgi:hypothetical protein
MFYAACAAELRGEETACELVERAWHGWLVFGVRGALEL